MAINQNNILQPGVDAKAHTQNLHQNVATQLSHMTGSSLNPAQVAPPGVQSPLDDSLKYLAEEPKTETDLEEIINAERGRPRTEPSKNFLRVLFGKLRKKHPGSTIKQEEKGK